MHRSRRDQHMIVLLDRPLPGKLLRIEWLTAPLRLLQGPDHLRRVHLVPQPEINTGIVRNIEDIITLILRIIHPEMFAYILRRWMHLQTQISAAHRIQEIEAYRELVTKTRLHRIPQQRAALLEHQVDRRRFEKHGPKPEKQTILLRHTIETPGIVGLPGIQIADLLHPLAAPRTGIKKRHYPERPPHRLPQRGIQHRAGDYL